MAISDIESGGVWQVGTTKTFYYNVVAESGFSDTCSMNLCPPGTNLAIFLWETGADFGYDGIYCSDKTTVAPDGLTIVEEEVSTNRYKVTVTIPANYTVGTYYLRNPIMAGGASVQCVAL